MKKIKKTNEQIDQRVLKAMNAHFSIAADNMRGLYQNYQRGTLIELTGDEVREQKKSIIEDLDLLSYVHDQHMRISGMPNPHFYQYDMLAKNTLDTINRWENS